MIVAGSLVVVDNERVVTVKLLDQQQQTARRRGAVHELGGSTDVDEAVP